MNYHRAFWLGIYVLAAIVVSIMIATEEVLLGDFKDVLLPDYHTLIIAISFIVVSYLIWMGPVFRVMEKAAISPVFKHWESDASANEVRLISMIVLSLQIAFMFYFVVEDIGIAGSIARSDSALKYLFILFPIDAIFLVYYALFRRTSWIAFNLPIFIFSNFMRGWFGFWMLILFIECAYRIHENRFKWKEVVLAFVLLVLTIPWLISLKWFIRNNGYSYLFNLDNVENIFHNVDWWANLVAMIEQLIYRLQHLDSLIVIIDNSPFLIEKLHNREFLYFFQEGLPQFAFERLFDWPRIPTISIQLIDWFALYKPSADVITNTHIGLVGWLWLMPDYWFLYLAYLLMLSWFSIWIAKKLGGSGLLIDLVWFLWLTLLMNGWFWAYIEFLQALVIMICIRVLISKISNRVGL